MFYYRLESPWADWDIYFNNELQYTGVRKIDAIEDHSLTFQVPDGQGICGLWMLSNFSDAIKFQESEPPIYDDEAKKVRAEACILRLAKESHAHSPLRFCARISSDALDGERVFPDLPLVHQYGSSCFHPRVFQTFGREWSVNASSSKLVPHVTIPDEYVDIYYSGAWYRKSPELGSVLRELLLSLRHVDGILLKENADAAPVGDIETLKSSLPVRKKQICVTQAAATPEARGFWGRLARLLPSRR